MQPNSNSSGSASGYQAHLTQTSQHSISLNPSLFMNSIMPQSMNVNNSELFPNSSQSTVSSQSQLILLMIGSWIVVQHIM